MGENSSHPTEQLSKLVNENLFIFHAITKLTSFGLASYVLFLLPPFRRPSQCDLSFIGRCLSHDIQNERISLRIIPLSLAEQHLLTVSSFRFFVANHIFPYTSNQSVNITLQNIKTCRKSISGLNNWLGTFVSRHTLVSCSYASSVDSLHGKVLWRARNNFTRVDLGKSLVYSGFAEPSVFAPTHTTTTTTSPPDIEFIRQINKYVEELEEAEKAAIEMHGDEDDLKTLEEGEEEKLSCLLS